MARQRGGGQRMGKLWDQIPGSTTGLTANSRIAPAGLAASAPQTVLRMIGEYVIGLSGAATIGDSVEISIGIGVVSTDAFTAGTTALPDPAGEPDFPWLFWAQHKFRYPGAVGTAVGEGVWGDQSMIRRSFDIRSMRKMKPRETLMAVLQYVDVVGTPPMRFDLSTTRVLLGLH